MVRRVRQACSTSCSQCARSSKPIRGPRERRCLEPSKPRSSAIAARGPTRSGLPESSYSAGIDDLPRIRSIYQSTIGRTSRSPHAQAQGKARDMVRFHSIIEHLRRPAGTSDWLYPSTESRRTFGQLIARAHRRATTPVIRAADQPAQDLGRGSFPTSEARRTRNEDSHEHILRASMGPALFHTSFVFPAIPGPTGIAVPDPPGQRPPG